MSNAELRDLANQAAKAASIGIDVRQGEWSDYHAVDLSDLADCLFDFAVIIRADEREACARVAEQVHENGTDAHRIAGEAVDWDMDMIEAGIAAAIRARGEANAR